MKKHTLALSLSLTCPESHECSACRCACLCALLKCHWMSYGLLSSQLQSGRHWPPVSSSLRLAAWWKTNAPRTPGHLRQTDRGTAGRETVKQSCDTVLKKAACLVKKAYFSILFRASGFCLLPEFMQHSAKPTIHLHYRHPRHMDSIYTGFSTSPNLENAPFQASTYVFVAEQ